MSSFENKTETLRKPGLLKSKFCSFFFCSSFWRRNLGCLTDCVLFQGKGWTDVTRSTNPLETAVGPQWHNSKDCCSGKDQGRPSDPVSSLEVAGTAASRQGTPRRFQGFVLSSHPARHKAMVPISQKVQNTLLTAHIPLLPAPGPHASGTEALLGAKREGTPGNVFISRCFGSFHSNHAVWKSQPFLGWNGCQY